MLNRSERLFIAVTALIVSECEPVAAYRSESHDSLTVSALGQVNIIRYPDIDRYSSTIRNHSHGPTSEGYAHGGPDKNLAQRESDWIHFNGGPFAKWIDHVLADYTGQKFVEAYTDVGYLTHLIEDQTSPPHAANISHGMSDKFESNVGSPQVTIGAQVLDGVAGFPDLMKYYGNALLTSQSRLPTQDFKEPTSAAQYWIPGPTPYNGDAWSSTTGQYGCITVSGRNRCDLFTPAVSPNVIPSQTKLATSLTAGFLQSLSKLLPPLIQNQTATLTPTAYTGQSALTIKFHAMENRTQTVYVAAEVFDSNGADVGPALPRTPMQLSAGSQLPWEGDVSLPWTPSLTDGNYLLRITLQDDDGNTAPSIGDIPFTVDTQAPVPQTPGPTVPPTPGSASVPGACVALGGADATAKVCSVSLQGAGLSRVIDGLPAAQIGPVCPANLPPGCYTQVITDCAGNSSTAQFCVPSQPAIFELDSDGVTRTATVNSAALDGARLELTINSITVGANPTLIARACEQIDFVAGGQHGTCTCDFAGGGGVCTIRSRVTLPARSTAFTVTNTTNAPTNYSVSITAALLRPDNSGVSLGAPVVNYAPPTAQETLGVMSGTVIVPDFGFNSNLNDSPVCYGSSIRPLSGPLPLPSGSPYPIAKASVASAFALTIGTDTLYNDATAYQAAIVQRLAGPVLFRVDAATPTYFLSPANLTIWISSQSAPGLDRTSLAVYQLNRSSWRAVSPLGVYTAQSDGSLLLKADIDRTGVYAYFYMLPDNFPPRTSLQTGDPSNTDSGLISVTSSTPFTLSAVDDGLSVGDGTGRGVMRTYYALDSGAFQVYAGSFSVSAEGSHALRFYSIDVAGNAEAVHSTSILIDSTPPGPPILLAQGANPSPWSNTGVYALSISTPTDASGVILAMGIACRAPTSDDDGAPLPFDNALLAEFSPPCLNQGGNPVYVWLMDSVGNASYRSAAQILLRYDDSPPSSVASITGSTFASGTIPVQYAASDPGADAVPATGSGVQAVQLWYRKDSADDGVFGPWQLLSASQTTPSGRFDLVPVGDGNYDFYPRALDAASNAEPIPVSTTIPKAQAFFDGTPPLITAAAPLSLTPASAQIRWTTDDLATGLVEYGTTTALGARMPASGQARSQELILSGLSYPATIYYRITAVNKTQLQTVSPISSFSTPPLVILPSDPFGVIATTQPILVQVDNPALSSSGSFTVDGQSGTLVPGTTNVFQITLSTGLSGSQTLTINLGGYIYNTSFIVDTATRSVRLARLVLDGGGVMTSTQSTPGSSMLDVSAGEAVTGPPSDQTSGFMSSGQSRLMLGYYSGIDPVAPGAVTSLSASAGPGPGQATLSWTAPGNDAYAGTAMSYELRYSTLPITDNAFAQATAVALSTYPTLAGTPQQALVSGLADAATYYFAIKAVDGLLNASAMSNLASTATYAVARSTDLTGGHPTITLISNVSGVSISLAASTGTVPAVALATSAAAAQGLLFASPIYDILSPLNPLPGGATIQFYYDPTGLDPTLQSQLRIYHLSANSTTWVLVADAAPILSQNLLVESLYSLSLFAIMMPDHVAPQTSLTAQGGRRFLAPSGSFFTSTSTVFGLSAQDPPLGRLPGVGVLTTEFRVDSATAPLTALAPSTAVFQLASGLHSVDFRSTDLAGNVAPLQSAVVGVDGAPPMVRVAGASGAYAALSDPFVALSTAAALSFQVVDPLAPGGAQNDGAGVSTAAYSVDGGPFLPAGAGFSLNLGPGLHTLAVVAQDNVGNVLDRSAAPYRIIVGDAQPPRTTLAISTPQASAGTLAAAYVSRFTTFTLTSVDDLSTAGDGQGLGVAFQQLYVDGSPRAQFADASPAQGQAFLSAFSLAADSDGVHVLGYLAQDIVQNRETLHITTVAVDNTAPTTRLLVSSPSFGAYVSSLTAISLIGADPAVNGVASGLALTRYRDDGGAFQSYLSTFTLAEGAHQIDFQSQDRVGNAGPLESAALLVDATPPVTSVGIGSPAYTGSDGALYVTTTTPVTLAALDPDLPRTAGSSGTVSGSGVSRIDVSLDSAPFSAYASTLTFAEGRHAVQYRAVDNVGNPEPLHTLFLSVDATPPLVSFQVLGSSWTDAAGNVDVSTRTALGFLSVDPAVAGVASGVRATRYQVDGGSFAVYGGSFTLAAADGARVLAFQATDNAGNVSLLRSATVYLDAAPPVTALSIGAPQSATNGIIYVSSMTPFSLAAADPVVGGIASGVNAVLLSLNGAAFAAYAGTFAFAAPDGAKSASWYALDNVGNAEVVKSSSVALDSTPPQTALSLAGGTTYASTLGVYASSATRVLLSAADPLVNGAASGIAFTRWQDNGGAFQLYASSLAFAEGGHTLGYQSQDNVANLEVLRSTTVLIDATPPVTTAAFGSPTYTAPDGTLYVATTTLLSFAAADPTLASSTVAGSGVDRIEVSIDSAPFASYSSALTFPEGAHLVLYRAVDKVGNVEAVRTLALRADATPPVSSLVIASPQFALSSATVLVSSLTPLGVAAVDPASNGVAAGVRQTLYSVNGSPFAVFAASFTLTAPDGPQTVSFYAQDNVLNTEAVKTRTLILDSTPPEVALLSPGSCPGGVCRVVKGKVPVIGRVSDAHLLGYVLDFAPGQNAAAGYALISSGTAPAASGLLGTWNADPLTGWQTLRLTATDAVGNASAAALSVFVGDPGEPLVLGGHDVFDMPQGVASDRAGNIYAADTNADRVAVFTATGAFVAAYGQGHKDPDDHRSASALRLNKPKGVAVDGSGNVFVADTNNDRVLKLSATGQVLLSLGRRESGDKDDRGRDEARPGKALGEFNKPSGIALDADGNIYVADTNNNRVQVLTSTGGVALAFTLPPVPVQRDDERSDRDADQPGLGRPVGVAVDAARKVYVADPAGARALVYDPAGRLLLTIPITGTTKDGEVAPGRPMGVAVSTDGYCLLVSDRKFDRILKFDALGGLTLSFGATGHYDARTAAAGIVFRKPAGLALTADGTLLVADRNNDRVERFGLPTGRTLVVPPASGRDEGLLAQDVLDSDAGGTVARSDKAGVTVPPGALADDLKITVSSISAGGAARANAMEQAAGSKGLAPAYAPVEYGPEGTKFNVPVTIVQPYDPNLVAAEGISEDSLKIHYWNPGKNDWEALDSSVDKAARTVTAKTPHFSLYQVLGSTGAAAVRPLAVADPTFAFHDAYAFPNPVRGARVATVRIQPGLADSVEVHVYDVSGRKVHSSSDFQQNILDDGNGKGFQYTFDHAWDVSGVGSGVYLYVITARKAGMSDIHKTGRVAVVK